MSNSQNPSQNPTYMAYSQSAQLGKQVLAEFREECKRPLELTEELLLKILDDNKDTEYGKKYHFKDIHSIEAYQKNVPVVVYDDLAPYLERMMAGEKDILTSYSYDHMNETSGTIGAPKVVPMTDAQSEIYQRYNYLLNMGLYEEYLSPEWKEARAFCTSSGNYRRLPSGITVGSASSKAAEFLKGGAEELDTMIRIMFTSPVEGLNPIPKTDNKYIHARFALMDRETRGIITGFFSVAILYLQYIADNYEMLIDDIENGTINEDVRLTDEVRASLLKKIVPMPERAAELREAFKDGADFPFISKIWPHMQYIFGVGADGFSIYDKTLRERFAGDTLTAFYAGITASEGLWSVPIGPNDPNSAICAKAAFIEFLPVEAGSDFTQCKTLDQLEVGKTYELIITNLSGFYRYRMSDAVQVTGFYEKTPLVQFMYRVNRTVNLAAEKTTEKALQVAVENAANELGFALSDFSVYPDSESIPGKYVFLIEPRNEKEVQSISRAALRECLLKHLSIANPSFRKGYDNERLDLDAWFLQPETSLLYRDMMVFNGAPLNQLKPVRVIVNEKQRKFFFGLIDRDIE